MTGVQTCALPISRWIFVFKYIRREINKIVHPKGVYPIRLEGGAISTEVAQQIMAFVIFYFAIFAISAFLVGFIEQNASVAIVGSIASLGNVGPGFGAIGPLNHFEHLTNATKLIFMFDMLIGRLELIPFLALLHKDLWQIKK